MLRLAVLMDYALQAEELYVAFDNDAGDLVQLQPVTSVKLDRVFLDSTCFAQEGCCLLIKSAGGLKSPSLTADSPKVVPVANLYIDIGSMALLAVSKA